MRHLLIIALVGAGLALQPAAAHQRVAATLNCPSTAQETRARHIQERIDALQARLDALDSKLDDFDSDRRAALEEAKVRIEGVARNGSLSPAQINQEVTHAIARADARARSVARSASAAQAEKVSVKSRMQALEQQLHSLARQDGAVPDDG